MSFSIEDYEGEVHRLAANNTSEQLYETARKHLMALHLQHAAKALSLHMSVHEMASCGCPGCLEDIPRTSCSQSFWQADERTILIAIELLDPMAFPEEEIDPEDISYYLEGLREDAAPHTTPPPPPMAESLRLFAGIYLAIAGIVGAIAIIEESPEKRKQRQEAGFMLSAISFTITNLLWPVVLIHAFVNFSKPHSDD